MSQEGQRERAGTLNAFPQNEQREVPQRRAVFSKTCPQAVLPLDDLGYDREVD